MALIRINGRGYLGPRIANIIHRMETSISVEISEQVSPYKKFPDVIIHTSWQTNVDKCTTDPKESYFISMKGFLDALDMHRNYGSHLIFISSAYVFGGDMAPYSVDSDRHPVQRYGHMKAEAEDLLLHARNNNSFNPLLPRPRGVSIRTDALYDHNKRYAYEKSATDQISNPTYMPFLAEVLARYARVLINREYLDEQVMDRETYHVTGPETMSRFDFVKHFSHPRTEPCLTSDLRLPADRPRNSSLINSNDLIDALGVKHVSLDEAILLGELRREH